MELRQEGDRDGTNAGGCEGYNVRSAEMRGTWDTGTAWQGLYLSADVMQASALGRLRHPSILGTSVLFVCL